jgi:tetratricopeptide (TPR) repeat protein
LNAIPNFALAHAWLSYVSMNIYFSFDPRPARAEAAERHYRQAMTIDPSLPEANLAKAYILWSPAKNFQHAEAIAALERALEARPNLEQAHNRMSSICLHIGRFEEAHVAHERSQRANPKNPQLIYLWSGDFERAERAADSWMRESPGNPQVLWFYPQPPLMTGKLDVAERRLAASLKLLPDDPLIISLQGILHARHDEPGPAVECALRAMSFPLANGHFHHVYYQVACIYAVLGPRLAIFAAGS